MADARTKVLELIQRKDQIDRLIGEQGRILEMVIPIFHIFQILEEA